MSVPDERGKPGKKDPLKLTQIKSKVVFFFGDKRKREYLEKNSSAW